MQTQNPFAELVQIATGKLAALEAALVKFTTVKKDCYLVVAHCNSTLLPHTEFKSSQLMYVLNKDITTAKATVSTSPEHFYAFTDEATALRNADKFKARNGYGPIAFFVITVVEFLNHHINTTKEDLTTWTAAANLWEVQNPVK